MAKLKLNDVFDSIFSAGEDFLADGIEWIQRYKLVDVDAQEAEEMLSELKSAFAGAINKKKLAKINLIWKTQSGDEDVFIGLAPAQSFYNHRPAAKEKVMIVMVERYQGKVNLIDPSTGEIRQNIPK